MYHVPCYDGVNLQNDCLVLLLHYFQFAELYSNYTICPVAESIIQYIL